MRVILLSDLRQGRRGQEVEVKPGFARNYLLPQGMAVEATDGNRKWFESQRKKIDARAAKERDEAAAVAAEIGGIRLEITKRVGETETLYGSVTATEVGEALAAKGIDVDRRKIDVHGGIKTVGDHQVLVHLHPDVTAELTVTVVPEE
ncbi:MAG TPA: 50S ribosomal protein L9 [Thermoanaerobaculia bacterium]|nr:50S ribosomal protein L9 [Thermoanaerobaculia bacterium]